MVAGVPASAEAALDRVKDVPAVRRIILFGSRAVGDADERSDVDLAISAPDLDPLGLARLKDAVATAPTLYQISVMRLEDMPRDLRDRVASQGRVIYERP